MPEIIRVEGIGFCYGVDRAIRLAEQAAAQYGSIATLGPLIHNPAALAGLKPRIYAVRDLDEVSGEAVLIRSHGVPPEVFAEAERRGLLVIDATCPCVARVQRLARDAADAGRQVVVLGDAAHPEVVGICGWAGGKAIVVADAESARSLPAYPRVTLLAQTTESAAEYAAVAKALEGKTPDLRVEQTLCPGTQQVQQATAQVADQVDAMIVIGGKQSANTRRLAQISGERQIDVYFIETAADLDCDIVRRYRKIGITAGTSTPQHIIEEVHGRMTDLEKLENQQAVAAETAETTVCECAAEKEENCQLDAVEQTADPVKEAVDQPSADAAEPVAAAEPAVPAEEAAPEEDAAEPDAPADEDKPKEVDAFTEKYGDMKEIRRGARVKGVVVQVKDDELLVDIGGKSEGVLSASELSADDAKNIRDRFQPGDEIDVLILRRENQEGYPVLSKRRVDQDVAWDRLAQLKQEKAIVSGRVIDVVKGGVLVDVGLRGFVPASLVSMGYVEDLSSYIGCELQMKIIECDKHSNKLVLSAKAVLRNASKAMKEKTWSEVAVGQTRHGVVRRLTGFGAFVDIGGVDGLLHVSEMAWYRVNHPADLLKEGDELEVYILGVDQENEKISLGLKQLIPNPWTLAQDKYPEGSVITAKVMRTTTFGAFLEVEPGLEGLVHISQLANHRVEKTEDVVRPGDVVEVKVLSVDPEAKRMSLSIKATLPQDEIPPAADPLFDDEDLAEEEAAPVEEPPVEAAVPAAESPVDEPAAAEE